MHKFTWVLTTAAMMCAAAMGSAVLGAQETDPAKLPDGPGKTIVQSSCTVCHGLELLSGRDEAAWKDTVDRMIAMGATVADDQVKVLVDYLVKNFPPSQK
jgi:cytochrome c5